MNVWVGRDIAAEPSVAWDLLVDTDRWPQWGPSVAAVELDGVDHGGVDHGEVDHGGVDHDRRIREHSSGRVRTALGMWVPFVVTGFEPGLSWSWRVAGVPATTHRVTPHEGGCRVDFGIPVLAAPYAVVCRAALGRIEHLALGVGDGSRP